MGFLWAAEASGGGGGGSGYWQLALVLAGIGFLGLFARWRKAKTPKPVDTREFRERDQSPNRYRDAADRAIVDLLETSRTLNAQVDTKIRILNRLVKEAEEQTARLEKLLAEAKGEAEAAKAGDAPAPAAKSPAASARMAAAPTGRTELQERILLLKNEGKTIAEIAKATSLSTTEVRFALASMPGETADE